ncbi:MAG: hypothetical protein AMJ53_18670 [Gammaproteobacteria bacterium SG8_11]|nr:MAG: hypothetical protein AMJ53_18670 [Gammaproteobacteria bacterium SG8_11]
MTDPRILFITVGDRSWASSRMRSYWPADIMPNADVVQMTGEEQYVSTEYDAYIWMKTGNLEAMRAVKAAGKVQIVEVCDPNWWFQPDTTRQLIDQCTAIVAATKPAERDILEWYGRDIPAYYIPDRLNLAHFPARRMHAHTDIPRLIWFGIAANRVALYAATAYMQRLAANGHKFSLTICDEMPKAQMYEETPFPVYHVKWRLDQENAILADHDIALLPPYPGPWGDLKSNNKKLTAWACGLPVTDGQDWTELVGLIGDWRWRQESAAAGYNELFYRYQTEHTAAQWNEIVTELMQGAEHNERSAVQIR